MTFIDEYRTARHAQGQKFANKRLQKALRKTPNAEWLYTVATTHQQVGDLAEAGWEVTAQTSLAPSLGTSIFTRTLMKRRNPALDQHHE